MRTPSRETSLARDLNRKYELDPKLTATDIRALSRPDYYLAAANVLARLYGRQRALAVAREARSVMDSWALADRHAVRRLQPVRTAS